MSHILMIHLITSILAALIINDLRACLRKSSIIQTEKLSRYWLNEIFSSELASMSSQNELIVRIVLIEWEAQYKCEQINTKMIF